MTPLGADQPWQCRCGQLRGRLCAPAPVVRLTCYCRDCQTAAHALGCAPQALDAQGGTEVVSTLQAHLRIDQGAGQLACLSLRPGGLLRWYASCCRTPLFNTTRDARLSYVGMTRLALGAGSHALDAGFGPAQGLAVNTGHAKGTVRVRRLATALQVAGIFAAVARARLGGRWKRTPLFRQEDRRPVAQPSVLRTDELAQAQRAADA